MKLREDPLDDSSTFSGISYSQAFVFFLFALQNACVWISFSVTAADWLENFSASAELCGFV